MSGLLAKLDEIEQMALAAKPHRQQLLWSRRAGNEKTNAYLTQVADPDEVLRLCRAHRDLIKRHAPERDGSGQFCATCFDPATTQDWPENMVQEQYPCPTLVSLARGLGVEEQSSE